MKIKAKNSEEYHEIMRDAVHSFYKKRAGFIAPKADDFNDLTFDAHIHRYGRVARYTSRVKNELEVVGIFLRSDEICYNCCYKMQQFFNQNEPSKFCQSVQIHSRFTSSVCVLCGIGDMGEIPF